MEEPKHRLQKARAAAGYESPSEAAKLIKAINKNTLISNENGNRPISRKAAEKYAAHFGVEAGWILFGDEGVKTPIDIPVLSMVSAGNLIEHESIMKDDIERWIQASDLPSGDWFALEVAGDSMNRIAPDASIILINRADLNLIDRRFYVFSSRETGSATFKQYRVDPPRMQPYSTNPEHMSMPLNDDFVAFARVRRVITDV